jgi:hypothetical protein
MRYQEQLTDCGEALREYDSLWSGTQRVLCVEGTSGVGKSTLIRFLVQCHETRRSRALLDLAEIPLARADIVVALTDQLAGPTGFPGSVKVRTSAGPFGRVTASPVVVAIGAEPELSHLFVLDYLRPCEWVLLVDHCEELDADPPLRRWFEGLLLPRLLGRFPKLRIVLAAESGPRGPAHERRSHSLRSWTVTESAAHLAGFGVTDTKFCRAVHEAFDGLGLFVDLVGAAWRDAEQTGRPFDLTDVAGPRAWAWLFDRLFARLPDTMGEAARVACRMRRFTYETLCAAGSLRELSDGDYHALTTRSWVHPFTDGGYEVHRRVRFVYARWCRDERPKEFAAFHARAQRIFDERYAPLDVLYHVLSTDPDAGIEAWVRVFDQAAEDERATLARLLHLPEIWAWLSQQGRATWYARAKGLIGLGGAMDALDLSSGMAVRRVGQQHEQTNSTVLTPTDLDARRSWDAR